jgi:hypothetical protein
MYNILYITFKKLAHNVPAVYDVNGGIKGLASKTAAVYVPE